jgi:tryptophanyl-tRNA synthetase
MTPGARETSLENRLLAQVAEPLGYRAITDSLRIGACGDTGFLRRRFLAHFDADTLTDVSDDRIAIVTGFGPTNAPTLGTLSAMLATCELQRRSRLHTTVVVSDLGAWNSRNLAWQHLEQHRDRMLAFLEALGFDTHRGVLRTHQDETNLILSGRITRFLTEQDFLSHREVLDDLYQDLGARGPQLGVMVDGLYTIADIVGPLAVGHERVVMLAGIEEHYFTELSRLVLARCHEQVPEQLFAPGSRLAALFLGIVPGLGGHDKMSKSIPASAFRLN